MAKFDGFRCDGKCGPLEQGDIYPADQKNEVIVRFVGPDVSGETTKEYCPDCIKVERANAGPLTPLKKRHKASVPSPSVAPSPVSPTASSAAGGGA